MYISIGSDLLQSERILSLLLPSWAVGLQSWLHCVAPRHSGPELVQQCHVVHEELWLYGGAALRDLPRDRASSNESTGHTCADDPEQRGHYVQCV